MRQTRDTIKDEEIIVTLNDHKIVLLKPLISLVIGWSIFLILSSLSEELKSSYPQFSLIILLVNYVLILIVNHWSFLYIFEWLISTSYITNKRILIFNLLAFVKHDLVAIKIEEIHEVEEKQHGILANIFNYGVININLAAMPEPIKINYVPEPSRIVNLIETIRDGEHNPEVLKKIYFKKNR